MGQSQAKSQYSISDLNSAASNGDVNLAAQLMALGIQPDANTFEIAAYRGNLDILDLLLQMGRVPSKNELVTLLRELKGSKYHQPFLMWLYQRGLINGQTAANESYISGEVPLMIWLYRQGLLPDLRTLRLGPGDSYLRYMQEASVRGITTEEAVLNNAINAIHSQYAF